MCDIGVIPDNMVFYPNKNDDENGHEIIRNEETFFLRYDGEDGFVVSLKDLLYWSELVGYAYVNFKCYEDFLSLMNVNTVLHFLYCEKCNLGSFLRNDERGFYHELKMLEKLVDQCEVIEDKGDEGVVIFAFFEGIRDFLREYKKGF